MILKKARYKLLGISVNGVTKKQLLNYIEDAVDLNKKAIIAHHNLHSIYLYYRNKTMKNMYEGKRQTLPT